MSQSQGIPTLTHKVPPDQAHREAALDISRSVIVQAPAGSGKTDLLTRRFLRLLAVVEDPGQVVAITFTKAAAAEMRERILSELEKAASIDPDALTDEFSMPALACRALSHAVSLGWDLLNSPAQLRISTIDSFCRELAIQQPLTSGFLGDLNVTDNAAELYRQAARRTLRQIDNSANPSVVAAIQDLLNWRDNNWKDVEDQLAGMLEKRDRWMQDFVLRKELDLEELRSTLEAPFERAVSDALHRLTGILAKHPGACAEAHSLAQFACEQGGHHRDLAELADFPCDPFATAEELESARSAYLCLANMLLTQDGEFRRQVNKSNGFPAAFRLENARMVQLIDDLRNVPGLQESLQSLEELPPVRYSEDEWRIVRACFTLLRHAAAELRVVFEESGSVDFTEIAQRAQLTLEDQDGFPTEAGFSIAERIHHLLVDEFQDTSRRQHKLLTSLVKAWPDATDRTLFVVGDPMQSIYFFRDAEAELFQRVQNRGIEIESNDSLALAPVTLKANFRTAASLVQENNNRFAQIFGNDDGSGISFSSSIPARTENALSSQPFSLNLDFVPQLSRTSRTEESEKQSIAAAREEGHARQVARIVALIRANAPKMAEARARGGKHRIAVLGRTRNALAPIASALRDEKIPFRAVDLESFADRPEIQDVLAISRAVLNAEDRVAWLSVLRSPWCGLRADELHTLVSADDPDLLSRRVPDLIQERAHLLDEPACRNALRAVETLREASEIRRQNPSATVGTWLREVWKSIGGEFCVDATAAGNLDVLWNCLDGLPNGEVDLLGDGLKSRLSKLTAQPDPDAESDVGVQLMTIHKSKGLEFEVVIVPDLQACCGLPEMGMLSWLERGVASAKNGSGPTEFLIAPRQSKGSNRGLAKAWVDSIRRKRERQEMRRILYVAATRAREELHLFACPEYGESSAKIAPRTGSLLETAWSAIGDDVQNEFASWSENRAIEAFDLAAQSTVIEMPATSQAVNKSVLLRLPADLVIPNASASSKNSQPAMPRAIFERHKGGISSRASGTAVHTLLEEAARVREKADWRSVKDALTRMQPSVISRMRSAGMSRPDAERSASEAMQLTLAVLEDATGAWILSPHADANTEAAWTDWNGGIPRTVRVDRVFRAGNEPLANGDDTWWIVDYKTAHLEIENTAKAVHDARKTFEAQLLAYANVLRALRAKDARIHAGLYYPRMRLFDWWPI
jgi:ATP-dependent exoDNAse (exonuclease V) beta subunit